MKRCVRLCYTSEVPEKGISFGKLALFAVAIALVVIATKNGVDKYIIKALLDLLK